MLPPRRGQKKKKKKKKKYSLNLESYEELEQKNGGGRKIVTDEAGEDKWDQTMKFGLEFIVAGNH